MRTLYDVLGARPDDDTESLKKAFRRAAKANHPDLHAGDPAAAARFRQIAAAYDILRDSSLRAAYDQRLRQQRQPPRSRSGHTAAERRRHFLTDAITATVAATVLIGGYILLVQRPGTAVEKAKDITAREPVQTAAIPPHDGAAGQRTAGNRSGAADDARDAQR
jgi:curved DNA-binding protein CbpA